MATRPKVEDPTPASAAVRDRFRRQRTRDTAFELELRRKCWALGLRYYVGRRPLATVRRTADLVFPRQRVAVFADGCFWHQCPECRLTPRNNADWWAEKLSKNVQRDRETDRLLTEAGWIVLRFWEHGDTDEAARRVSDVVTTRRASRP